MDLIALKKEARDKTTSDARLKELALLDLQLAQAIVKRAAPLSPALLEQLSRHADMQIQRAVAANHLASTSTLEYLSGHGQWTVLKAVAENPNSPKAVTEKLSLHKRNSVRQAVVKRTDLNPQQIERLVADTDALVRLEVVQQRFGSLTKTQQDRLLTDAEVSVRLDAIRIAVQYAQRPECAIPALQDPDASVRTLGVQLCEFEILKQQFGTLIHDPDPSVRAALAWRLDEPSRLHQLASDPASTSAVLTNVAKNPFTPDSALHHLSQSNDGNVLKALTRNPFCPPEALDKLARGSQKDGDLIEDLIMNPSTGPETLRWLYKRGIPYFQQANAWGQTANWPADLLVKFMGSYYSYSDADEPIEVRRDQKHFDSIRKRLPPEEVLAWAATSSLHYHSCAAVGNRHTPPQAIAAFVRSADHDEDESMLEDVARNPATPASALRKLVTDFGDELLKNPFLPDSILELLPEDKESSGWYCHIYARVAKDLLRVRQSKGISVDDQGKVTRQPTQP